MEETFKTIKSNRPPSTAIVAPKPLNIPQRHIEMLKHLQGWRFHHLPWAAPTPDHPIIPGRLVPGEGGD